LGFKSLNLILIRYHYIYMIDIVYFYNISTTSKIRLSTNQSMSFAVPDQNRSGTGPGQLFNHNSG